MPQKHPVFLLDSESARTPRPTLLADVYGNREIGAQVPSLSTPGPVNVKPVLIHQTHEKKKQKEGISMLLNVQMAHRYLEFLKQLT